MPLVYPIVIVQFGLNVADIGTFIAVTSAVGGLMQLTYGFLTRWIARPALLAGGQLIFGASLMVAGLAQSAGQLLAAISAARIGASPQHPVGNAILSDTFPLQRRGFAISAHISGGNVGTILVPFVGTALLAGFGWNVTLVLFGVPALLMGIVIGLRVREDGAAYRDAARSRGSPVRQFGEVLRRRDLMLILGAALVGAGGRGLDIVAPFMILYLRGPLGLDEATTALLYAMLLVGSVVGPLLAGFLSDRFGRKRTAVAYYLLSALGIGLFVVAGANLILLVPLLLPFGTAVFSEGPILQAFLADRAEGRLRDVAFSVYFTFAVGVGAFWAFVIGWIVTVFGFVPAFVVMGVSYLAATLLIAAVPDRHAADRGAPYADQLA